MDNDIVYIDESLTFDKTFNLTAFDKERDDVQYKFWCDKLAVMNNSKVFKVLLEDDNKCMSIQIKDYSHDTVGEVLKYIHTPKWTTYISKNVSNEDTLYQMIKFCHQYDIPSVLNILEQHAKKIYEENPVRLLEIGTQFKMQKLTDFAISQFAIRATEKNWEAIIKIFGKYKERYSNYVMNFTLACIKKADICKQIIEDKKLSFADNRVNELKKKLSMMAT